MTDNWQWLKEHTSLPQKERPENQLSAEQWLGKDRDLVLHTKQ